MGWFKRRKEFKQEQQELYELMAAGHMMVSWPSSVLIHSAYCWCKGVK